MYSVKVIFIALFLFLSFSNLLAQGDQKNIEKYWNYRERFLNGFISIGMERGESVPMHGLVPQGDCDFDFMIGFNNCNYAKPGNGILYFGDQLIVFGNYLAVLSLEIRNLKDAGHTYAQTAEELYYALKAIERIDRNAETYFGSKPELNGFMVRDDVPLDFHEKMGKARFKNRMGGDYSCVISDGGCDLDNVMDGSVMSQDQLVNLLFGYTFITELIPEIKHNNTILANLAKAQTHRIATFLTKNKWKIRTPDGKVPKNSWGGNTTAFSYVIAKTADRITGGKYQKSYQTGRSKRRGKMIFNTFNWAHGIQAERNLWMAYAAAVSSGSWNGKKLTKRALKADKYMYALAYAVLNNNPLEKPADRDGIKKMINSAPWDGPCYNTPGCKAPDGWKSHDRWVASDQKNGNPYKVHRDYNGLDFMLFYNLYHYLFKNRLPDYGMVPNQ